MNKPGRTMVIGDVHGCSDELRDLLRALAPGPEDELISVGDLMGKGPDSLGVLEWAMEAKRLACVLGNHELRFLRAWRQGGVPDEKAHDRDTVRQLGGAFDRCLRFIDGWPLYEAREELLVVHAGLDPRLPALSLQSEKTLTGIRTLEDGTPWYEDYRDPRLVVFGHWARPEPVLRENAVGLDTGCVYGGRLSALILPERRLVSVPARKAYRTKEGFEPRLEKVG